ncbi:MAG TPA: ABC transporter permease [Candidatus Acidoferrales bacterium]
MSAILAVLYREYKIRLTNLTWLFYDLLLPLGYLLIFGVGFTHALGSEVPGLTVDYNAFFLAGVLAMAGIGIASNTAWAFFVDRDNGIFYEFLTYPLRRGEFLVGKILFNILLAVLQGMLTIGLAVAVLRVPIAWPGLPLTILGIVTGTAGWFFFFAVFALRIRRNDIFNTIVSLFYFVFLLASSMFYPLERAPTWFRVAAYLNPTTWQVDFLRFSTIGLGSARRVAMEALAFLVFASASFVLASRSFQRRD